VVEQVLLARHRALRQTQVAVRLARVGLCLSVVGRGELREHVAALHVVADLRADVSDSPAERGVDAHGGVLVPGHAPIQLERGGLHLFGRRDFEGGELGAACRQRHDVAAHVRVFWSRLGCCLSAAGERGHREEREHGAEAIHGCGSFPMAVSSW
jgi:hypothetical protein